MTNLFPKRKSTSRLRGCLHDRLEVPRRNTGNELAETERFVINEVRKNLSSVFEREIPVLIRYTRCLSQFPEIGEFTLA